MKKTINFIVKVIVAALVGFAAMCIAIAFDASDKVAIMSYFGVAIAIAAVLGAFDMSAQKRDMKHTSIKDAARYGQAAIFVGTAAIFVGTPQECEELADDMHHYAQQAEVRALTGEESFDIL
ncbi:MAG: hypothetical protein J6Y33_03085 [Prevotella sp.]|nr:hypothetical protein [Prevotella sp.]